MFSLINHQLLFARESKVFSFIKRFNILNLKFIFLSQEIDEHYIMQLRNFSQFIYFIEINNVHC